jgi:putative hydrolase of the HAD superfamily
MSRPSPTRAVFFDIGGTLIEPWPSVGAVYARVGMRHGFHADPSRMESAFRLAWKQGKDQTAGGGLGSSDKQWWRRLVFAALDNLSLDADPIRRTAYFEDLFGEFARPDAWRMFDDVEPTLTRFRREGVHVGAISNWDDRLRPLLAALGLANKFDSITISCEEGVEKPDARIFAAACGRAGSMPEECLHVGDSLEEDVQGAVAAGMRALWIVRDHRAGVEHERRCDVVRTLADVSKD